MIAIIGLVFCMSYIFYAAIGFNSYYKRKLYFRLLLRKRLYSLHLSIALLTAGWALYYCCHGYAQCSFLVAPAVFLLLLKCMDLLVLCCMKRHILLIYRDNFRPAAYRWYLDGILSMLVLMLPLFFSGILMNWFRFGRWFA